LKHLRVSKANLTVRNIRNNTLAVCIVNMPQNKMYEFMITSSWDILSCDECGKNAFGVIWKWVTKSMVHWTVTRVFGNEFIEQSQSPSFFIRYDKASVSHSLKNDGSSVFLVANRSLTVAIDVSTAAVDNDYAATCVSTAGTCVSSAAAQFKIAAVEVELAALFFWRAETFSSSSSHHFLSFILLDLNVLLPVETINSTESRCESLVDNIPSLRPVVDSSVGITQLTCLRASYSGCGNM
jgi:hypothetical protein